MTLSMLIKRQITEWGEVPNLGEKVKAARLNSGKSLAALAREAEVSRQYWYSIENETIGTKGITEDVLKKLEKVLGIAFEVEYKRSVEE